MSPSIQGRLTSDTGLNLRAHAGTLAHVLLSPDPLDTSFDGDTNRLVGLVCY